MALISQSPKPNLAMSVITSSEGFVRLGLLTPQPDRVLYHSFYLLFLAIGLFFVL